MHVDRGDPAVEGAMSLTREERRENKRENYNILSTKGP